MRSSAPITRPSRRLPNLAGRIGKCNWAKTHITKCCKGLLDLLCTNSTPEEKQPALFDLNWNEGLERLSGMARRRNGGEQARPNALGQGIPRGKRNPSDDFSCQGSGCRKGAGGEPKSH